MEIKVIGFDLDNTLYAQSEEMQGRIRGKIYEKLADAISVPVEEAKQLFESNYNGNFSWSHSGSRTLEEIGRGHKVNLSNTNIVQKAIEEADILDLIPPNQELDTMLTRLKSQFNLDLITGTSYDLAYSKLQRLGVGFQVFGNILAEGKYGGKTNGEVYKHWIQKRQTPPNQMLYVGDNKKQDVLAPMSLGIKTCYVGTGSVKSDFHIRDILELKNLEGLKTKGKPSFSRDHDSFMK